MNRFLDAARNGGWVTWPRIRAYCTLLAIAYLTALIWGLTGHGNIDPDGHPLGSDFVSFWTVSSLLHSSNFAAIYHPEQLAGFELNTIGTTDRTLFYAWFYPPIALLLVWPLALLPYLWSLLLWLSVGVAAYLTLIRLILPDRRALIAAVAFPAVFLTLTHGQNAFVSTALLGSGLMLLKSRPVVAGILIGALTFKPQLGLLIPFALVAGEHWRAILAASVTAFVLAMVSALLFGADAWSGFLAVSDIGRQTLEQGLVPYYKMQSPFSTVRNLGAPLPAAYAVQLIVSATAAAAVVWAWRRPVTQDIKNAILVIAGPLATPFVFDYDLLILALPIAWMSAHILRDGQRPYEKTCLAAVFLLPLVTRPLAGATGLCLTPFLLATCLALIMRRARSAEVAYRPGANLR